MGPEQVEDGAPPASQDRATDATHEAPTGLRPDGSVSTGAWRAPWQASDIPEGSQFEVLDADDEYVCGVDFDGYDISEARKTALLIAAAPDLYADLAVLVKAFGQSSDHGLWTRAKNTLARAASCDTHPKDGDALAAPLVSGAVPKADAQTEPSND